MFTRNQISDSVRDFESIEIKTVEQIESIDVCVTKTGSTVYLFLINFKESTFSYLSFEAIL